MPWVTGWSTNSTMYLNGILGIYKRPAKSATFATASQTRHYASDCFTACSCSMLFPHCSHIVPSFPQFSAQQLNSSTAPRRYVASQPWFAMVPIVSLAGEELLTLELKDDADAQQLQMEVSAIFVQWRCVKCVKNGQTMGKTERCGENHRQSKRRWEKE